MRFEHFLNLSNFFFQSFSFNSERLPQYKRESDKKSKFLFLHYSATKGFWDWWILVLTTYIAIMVPYNVAFRRNDRKRDLIIFDMVIELFFIMDIVVHFRTSFVDRSGRIIYDQKKIAIHYLKGWFILDFLAALPFEALYFVNHTWVSTYYATFLYVNPFIPRSESLSRHQILLTVFHTFPTISWGEFGIQSRIGLLTLNDWLITNSLTAQHC